MVKLTKQKIAFEAPFDIRFRDYMIETTKHLMGCGFKIKYAYIQSDEISLLFDLNEGAFSRKTRKINSILAGEASAMFSVLLGQVAAFDCRISELPNGLSKTEATKQISGASISDEQELLFQHDINYNDLSSWEKRGVGLYYRIVEKEGLNKKTQESIKYERRELYAEYELPMCELYKELLEGLLNQD